MTFFAYLAIYLICSFFMTFIFSCSCGLSDSLADRRKHDRREKIRQKHPDRRVSYKFHTLQVDDIWGI